MLKILLYNFRFIYIYYISQVLLFLIRFYKFNFRNIKKGQGIVYMADGKRNPGGLCDRLHGILSCFKYSKDHNIKFHIYFNHPFQLKDYLNVSNNSIYLNDSDALDVFPSALPLNIFTKHGELGYSRQKESKFQVRFINLAKRLFKNSQLQVYTNARIYEDDKEFSLLFHELFSPCERLESELKLHSKMLNNNYIATVFRFQNLLGDFSECGIKELRMEEQLKLMQLNKAKIEEIYNNLKSKETKILVTSDSRKFLDYVDELSFVYTIPGKPVHMSFTENVSYDTHLKSFVDLFMISNAQKVYLLCTDRMYHSRFAEFAAMIGNKPYVEIFY